MGILAASGQLRSVERLRETALVGELGLDGAVRAVPGTMALAAASFAAAIPSLIVAGAATGEAATVTGLRVHGATSLGEAVGHLAGLRDLPIAEPTSPPAIPAGPRSIVVPRGIVRTVAPLSGSIR